MVKGNARKITKASNSAKKQNAKAPEQVVPGKEVVALTNKTSRVPRPSRSMNAQLEDNSNEVDLNEQIKNLRDENAELKKAASENNSDAYRLGMVMD